MPDKKTSCKVKELWEEGLS